MAYPYNIPQYQPDYFAQYRPQPLQRYEIIRVNGKNGAEALQMSPNSSVFVADETNANRIWLCMTDGAGFKTVRAIRCEFEDIAEPQAATAQIAGLEDRIARLEGIVNDKLNSRSVKSKQTVAESNAD